MSLEEHTHLSAMAEEKSALLYHNDYAFCRLSCTQPSIEHNECGTCQIKRQQQKNARTHETEAEWMGEWKKKRTLLVWHAHGLVLVLVYLCFCCHCERYSVSHTNHVYKVSSWYDISIQHIFICYTMESRWKKHFYWIALAATSSQRKYCPYRNEHKSVLKDIPCHLSNKTNGLLDKYAIVIRLFRARGT